MMEPSLELLNYDSYIKRFAILKKERLIAPRISTIMDLTLPRESILHHFPDNDVEYGIDPGDFILHEIENIVMVDHITEFDPNMETVGGPRKTLVIANAAIRDYHRRYLRFRPLHRLSSVIRDKNTLVVANYSILSHLYRYNQSFYAAYYKWANMYSAMWFNVNKYRDVTDRQQFIVFNLPATIPDVSVFRKFDGTIDKKFVETFNTVELLNIYELWAWLTKGPTTYLKDVPKEVYPRVNFVFKYRDVWTTINMDTLWHFEKHADEPNVNNADDPMVLAKKFLALLNNLHSAATPNAGLVATPVDATGAGIPDTPVTGVGQGQAPLDAPVTLDDTVSKVQPSAVSSVISELGEASKEPEAKASAVIEKLVDTGNLTAAEYKRLNHLSTRYKEIPNPFGEGTLEDLATIKPEDMPVTAFKFPKVRGVFDDSMTAGVIEVMDEQYINKVLQKDVAGAVLGLQAGGYLITDYRVEHIHDAMNDFYEYTVQITPVAGKVSTIRFKLPRVHRDGTFISNGGRRRMRRQRAEKPIRKIKRNQVALTSDMSKVIVTRSEAKVANYNSWIGNLIVSRGSSDQDTVITDLRLSDVFKQTDPTPRTYAALASRCSSFKIGDDYFYFDYTNREREFGAEVVKAVEHDGVVVVGKRGDDLLVMDRNSVIYNHTAGMADLGTIEDLAGIDISKAPVEYAYAGIYSKQIPVGIILAYKYGLDNLIKLLKINSRRVPVGGRMNLGPDEYAIRFADESIIFSKDDKVAALIMAGFRATGYDKVVQKYSSASFNREDVYYNVLNLVGVGGRWVKEMDRFFQLFVDPITREELVKMNEPTTFEALLIRSCELLLTDWAPAENSIDYQRLRGYERFTGILYNELVRAARSQGGKAGTAVEISPHEIWNKVIGDPSVKPIEESNPIHCLKEMEVVTYGGAGGRSDRSMVKRSRMMDRGDIGVVSEATPDSSQVGVISYLSANPNIVDVRGNARPINWETDGPANVLSTSALISPAAMHDEPRRVNFINIQQSAGISAVGYEPAPLRTGYEKIVPHRTGDLFAHGARVNGVILAKTKDIIVIQYEDGTKVSIDLGRRFGVAAGSCIPHEVVTDFNVGDKVNAGDIVTWNKHYYDRDPHDRKQVVFKNGINLLCALVESTDTLLDSDAISERTAEKMKTKFSRVKTRVVNFDQSIRDIVSVGDTVELDSILCSIEDAVTTANQLFDDESAEMLRLMSGSTLKSGYEGVVERIEVFYHGDKDDMSESLRDLADTNDRMMMQRCRTKGEKLINGSVDGAMRIDGVPLASGAMAIRFYITTLESAGVGDKFVFGNQLKSVCARVMSGVNRTESGLELDALFGNESVADRIVLSPEIMGTTNRILKTLSDKAVRMYRGKK